MSPSWSLSGMPGVLIMVLLQDTWDPHCGPSPGCLDASATTSLQDSEDPPRGPSLGQDACVPSPSALHDACGPHHDASPGFLESPAIALLQDTSGPWLWPFSGMPGVLIPRDNILSPSKSPMRAHPAASQAAGHGEMLNPMCSPGDVPFTSLGWTSKGGNHPIASVLGGSRDQWEE